MKNTNKILNFELGKKNYFKKTNENSLIKTNIKRDKYIIKQKTKRTINKEIKKNRDRLLTQKNSLKEFNLKKSKKQFTKNNPNFFIVNNLFSNKNESRICKLKIEENSTSVNSNYIGNEDIQKSDKVLKIQNFKAFFN